MLPVGTCQAQQRITLCNRIAKIDINKISDDRRHQSAKSSYHSRQYCLTYTLCADYQLELQGVYLNGKIEVRNPVSSSSVDFFSFLGTYYFDSVDTSKGSFALASFLDRASNVYAIAGRTESETANNGFNSSNYQVGTILIDEESGWLLNLRYSTSETGGLNIDTQSWSVGAGKYIAKNTTLTLDYTRDDVEGSNEDSETYEVSTFDVRSLSEKQAIAWSIVYDLENRDLNDDVDSLGITVTFYPQDYFSVGFNYSQSDASDTDLVAWGISTEWFITKQFAISFGYNNQKDDTRGFESDNFIFGARIRW